MARIKGIAISNLEGRIGNVVFRNRQGTNVASQRPASVKNPRSQAQQEQRMIFNTAVQAYSVLKNVADHSFEGVPFGAKSQAHFLKENLSLLRNTYGRNTTAFVWRRNNSYIPNNYLVSKGSLSSLLLSANQNGAGTGVLDNGVSLTLDYASNLPGLTATTTYADLLQYLDMKKGDELAVFGVIGTQILNIPNSTAVQVGNTYYVEKRYVFSLDVADSTLALKPLTGANQFELNPAIFSEIVGDSNILATVTSGMHFIDFDLVEGEGICIGCSAIKSRKSGSTWLRSTQYMVGNVEEFNSTQFEAGTRPELVVRSYNPNDPLFLNFAK